jgi:N-glycosylase/DNA lyase
VILRLPDAFHEHLERSLVEIPVRRFDLATTLGSGQVFHWQQVAGGFVGLVDRTPVFLRQASPDRIEVSRGAEELAGWYLALDHDLDAIIASFPADDAVLQRAIAFAPDLRLLRQPAWECLGTFITSSLKQVAHISQISHAVRRLAGEAIDFHGMTLHAYPSAEALAMAGEEALHRCGLGYRAVFLAQTAARVATGTIDLSCLTDSQVNDEAALAELLQAPGVGPKIASCVLLFAGQRHGFFPIDVWIERTLRQYYFPRRRKFPPGFLAEFVRRHFGPWRGYAQQFLFHHARNRKPETRNPKPETNSNESCGESKTRTVRNPK